MAALVVYAGEKEEARVIRQPLLFGLPYNTYVIALLCLAFLLRLSYIQYPPTQL